MGVCMSSNMSVQVLPTDVVQHASTHKIENNLVEDPPLSFTNVEDSIHAQRKDPGSISSNNTQLFSRTRSIPIYECEETKTNLENQIVDITRIEQGEYIRQHQDIQFTNYDLHDEYGRPSYRVTEHHRMNKNKHKHKLLNKQRLKSSEIHDDND